jgi:outer membrane protein OmpA-like peptidoglycan-associated protein
MHVSRRTVLAGSAALAAASVSGISGRSSAQEGLGPFMPHEGGVITTAWANAYGPDAESWIRFSKVGKQSFEIDYSSSRGMVAVRSIRTADRQSARVMVLGYNSQMPHVIADTTTLGISTAVLEELRTAGQASMGLIPDTSMRIMKGGLKLVGKSKLQIAVGSDHMTVPVVEASAQFSDGAKRAEGQLIILDNRNNPLVLEYTLNFKGEKTPRKERIVLVTPGAGMRSEMEQALTTIREYTTRGIHFDFDKATIRRTSAGLLDDIALTLRNNPLWTLQITGHTDSIGQASYNKELSRRRADAVKAALVKRGIEAHRLATSGAGASAPVASNKTLEGRAQNRRVVLARTDR